MTASPTAERNPERFAHRAYGVELSCEFREIEGHLKADQPVVDLVRAFGNRMSDGVQYQGICW